MYKELIKNWIPKLTPKIIQEYGKKLGFFLTNSETNILYQFIMKNYSEILDGNEKSFSELQKQISPTLYNQLLKIYNENKRKFL
ncbi:MAG: hypothetical protein PUE33_01025 [bacterium]|nr:hypothetical protein [bacterium]